MTNSKINKSCLSLLLATPLSITTTVANRLDQPETAIRPGYKLSVINIDGMLLFKLVGVIYPI